MKKLMTKVKNVVKKTPSKEGVGSAASKSSSNPYNHFGPNVAKAISRAEKKEKRKTKEK